VLLPPPPERLARGAEPKEHAMSQELDTAIARIIRVTYMFADKDTPVERGTYEHYGA
jgi:hypothetical protein